MKKSLVALFLVSSLLIISIIYLNTREVTVNVSLKDNLTFPVYSDTSLDDIIKSINGTYKNEKLNTKKVGKNEYTLNYKNNENRLASYTFTYEVVDDVAPVISLSSLYYVDKGSTEDFAKEVFCGDNYDDKPTCQVVGNYDFNTVGNYPLVYEAIDSSGNVTRKDFTILVREKKDNQITNSSIKKVAFKDFYKEHKNDNTLIGIDVSKWQQDIDYEKVKKAGVEFAFIRIGTRKGVAKEFVLDSKFKQNIEGFNKAGIKTGVYFYSYAKDKKDAKKEALWVLKELKDYNIKLPIVFDWENFSFYQEFNLSFYHLGEIANTFLETVTKEGYQGMLYGSKYYLENVFTNNTYPVWLAHYTTNTNYQNKYSIWQKTDKGVVDGINTLTDLDILYK
mgnify:FL=1